jgi:hypothetical protein
MREDGHVIVLDLSGLRREDSLSARGADRHWIDSVLGDQERTLRRRIHAVPGVGGGVPVAAGVPEPPLVEPSAAEPRPEQSAGPAPSSVPEDAASLPAPPLPAPRLRRARTEGHPSEDARRGGTEAPRRRRRGPVPTVLGVLAEPRHRRTALLSAGVVLVLGLGTGAALVLPGAPRGSEGSERSATATAPAVQGSAPGDAAPAIEDPWALAAELAGARHAYLTGISDEPVAAAGGAAEEEDERIRAAYEGLEVSGGGPVVHEAELVRAPDGDGTAVLRVLASSEDAEVVDGSGEVRETAAAAASTRVDLSLQWDGERWRIREVEAVRGGEG